MGATGLEPAISRVCCLYWLKASVRASGQGLNGDERVTAVGECLDAERTLTRGTG